MDGYHTSVLTKETIEALAVRPSDTIVDATLGGAGHFSHMLSKLSEDGILIGIDADPAAVERAREAYANDRRPTKPTVHLINDNFRHLTRILARCNLTLINGLLFDLGWSGYQIAESRGFSFQEDAPLLMTYSEHGDTAADLINTTSEKELAHLIFTYGEEHFSRGIAKAIVDARSHKRILTTTELVNAIFAGTPRWYQQRKTHAATKTFQALRIAVNDELQALREGLTSGLAALAPGGRLAVISFHSIEDRVVKEVLREASEAGFGSMTPRKPIVASYEEVQGNRRARSAKLRVFHRNETPFQVGSISQSMSSLLYA
jgi:16S rRNA (cytosine1402-N4)-methyltransferase